MTALCAVFAAAWARAGTEKTYRLLMRRHAYASRYGHAGAWLWDADSELVGDFCEALDEIVREENRGRA